MSETYTVSDAVKKLGNVGLSTVYRVIEELGIEKSPFFGRFSFRSRISRFSQDFLGKVWGKAVSP